ncbi:hypothetical protein GF312_17990 [Candidatus Poribacteria bacterium]|nr:hypothetical protein [Candidatus Poribacteria bacterium]
MQMKLVIGAAGTGKIQMLLENVRETSGSDHKILVLTTTQSVAEYIKHILPADNYKSVEIYSIKDLTKKIIRDKYPSHHLLSTLGSWLVIRKIIRSGNVELHSNYQKVKDKSSFIEELLELIQKVTKNNIPINQIPVSEQGKIKLNDIIDIYNEFRNFCDSYKLIPEFELSVKANKNLQYWDKRFSHILVYQCEGLSHDEIQSVKALLEHAENSFLFMDSIKTSTENLRKLADGITDVEKVYMDNTNPLVGSHINRLLGKKIYPDNQNSNIKITTANTSIDEAEYIARTIKKQIVNNNREYRDFAVLCSDKEILGSMVYNALKNHSIPCSGFQKIYKNPVIMFVLLCLRVVANPDNDENILKLLTLNITGINRNFVYKTYQDVERKKLYDRLNQLVDQHPDDFQKLGQLLEILEQIKKDMKNGLPLSQIIQSILENIAGDNSSVYTDEFITMIHNIEITYSEQTDIASILEDIEEGLKRHTPECLSKDENAVKLLSIQEADGLEFPVVFIPGMVSDFFPARYPARQLMYGEDLSKSRDMLRDINLPGTINSARWNYLEKLRFYTALTSANEEVYLTYARQYPENENCEPSSLLSDIMDGKEVSGENCPIYNITYQESTEDYLSYSLPEPGHIISDSEIELASYVYIKELERLDYSKSMEMIKRLTDAHVNVSVSNAMRETELSYTGEPFSNTGIKTFLSCPRRYFFGHILNIQVDYGPGALFGSLIHEVLGKFHRHYPELGQYDLSGLWNGMRRILLETQNKLLEAMPSRLQGKSYEKLAKDLLWAYLKEEHRIWKDGNTCIDTEFGFKLNIEEKYIIRGRMDRVDKNANGDCEIIDFKTSSYDKKTATAIKSKFLNLDDSEDYHPQDYQLPIYYLAAKKENKNPKILSIYQLRNISKRTGGPFKREIDVLSDKELRSDKKDTHVTEADMREAEIDLIQVLKSMCRGFYPPEPYEENTCERKCEYTFICEREESETEECSAG